METLYYTVLFAVRLCCKHSRLEDKQDHRNANFNTLWTELDVTG